MIMCNVVSEGWALYPEAFLTILSITDEIKRLSALRNLEKLTITMPDYLRSTDDRVTEVIEAARKVLAASPRPKKCLEVTFMEENRTVTFDYH
jgi:hypothetical protein